MTGSIICGVDNSASAREAARVARVLAGNLGLRLVFVRAAEGAASEAEMSTITERLGELRGGATQVDCGATWLIDSGDPADCLVHAANEEEGALIVVGSPPSGAVSTGLWRRSPCPVVVVPIDSEAVDRGGNASERPDDDRDFAGGIARLGFGGTGTAFDGGIVRFGLGLPDPGGL